MAGVAEKYGVVLSLVVGRCMVGELGRRCVAYFNPALQLGEMTELPFED